MILNLFFMALVVVIFGKDSWYTFDHKYNPTDTIADPTETSQNS